MDDTYRFLAKNCSNREIFNHRSYFVRHPSDLGTLLRTSCTWNTDWAVNQTEVQRKQRTAILQRVRNYFF